MDGSRQHILQLLQGHQGTTVGGLAHQTGLAPATVRRHLDILQRDRLVDYRAAKKPMGRPEHLYFLTEAGQEALPKGYARLLASLINEIGALDVSDVRDASGPQVLELALRRLSHQAVSQVPQGANGSLAERLEWLAMELEQRGFRPQVEVEEDGVVIRLLNCPFRLAARAHTAVCTFDRELIASLLPGEVTKQQCIHAGDLVCCYRARPDASRRTYSLPITPSPCPFP